MSKPTRTNRLAILLVTSILLCWSSVAVAQEQQDQQQDEEDIPSEKIEVFKDYKPSLADAVKIKFEPELPEIETTSPRFQYDIPVKLLSLSYEPPELKPISIATEKPEPFRESYIQAGFGTQVTPYLEAVYNTGEYQKYHFGASVRHISATESDIEHRDYSKNSASIFGGYYFNAIKLTSDLNFNLDKVHYYGFNESDTSFAKDDIEQRFTTFTWTTELKNTKANKAKIDHYTKVSPYFRTAKSGQDEFGLKVSEEISKRFQNKHYTNLTIREDFSSLDRQNDDLTTNLFSVKASYTFKDEGWELKAGLKATWEDDIFHFLPTFGAERKLVDDKIIYYNGLDMWIQKNSFRSFSDENPFIGPNIEYRNSRVEDRFTGFKGTVLKDLTYDVRFSSKEISDQHFFVNDTLDGKTFDVVYDDLDDFGVINLHVEVGYDVNERLKLSFLGDYYQYYLDTQEEAWHKPNFRLNVSGRYQIGQKIFLNAELYGVDDAQARKLNGEVEDLNGTFDINVGGEYRFTDLFSAWIQLNNLASIEHEKWYRYPTYGFNGLIGAKLRF